MSYWFDGAGYISLDHFLLRLTGVCRGVDKATCVCICWIERLFAILVN